MIFYLSDDTRSMGSRPILRGRSETGIWKKLDTDTSIILKDDGYFTDLADAAEAIKGQVNSDVLVGIIEVLYRTQCSDIRDRIPRLLAKAKSEDRTPHLTAVSVLIDLGDISDARELFDTISPPYNVPFHSCIAAKLLMAEGDSVAARKELLAARRSNPTYPMFYSMIQRLDPSGGWMWRQNIELLVAGEDIIPCGDSGNRTDARELFEICREWYRGSHDEATRRLIASEGYLRKDPEFILASARMSADEKDWHSAQLLYDTLLSIYPDSTYLLCEAGDVNRRGGNTEKSLSMYRKAEISDPRSPAVMSGLVTAYISAGMKEEAVDTLKRFLSTEDARAGSYVTGARMLLAGGLLDDARETADIVLKAYPKDPEASMVMADIFMAKDDHENALNFASGAYKASPERIDCGLKVCDVLVRMGRTDRALKELDKIDKKDPDNIGALTTRLFILDRAGDDAATVAMCNRILDLDYDNKDAIEILSRIAEARKDMQISTDRYRMSIEVDNTPENFINIVSTLIRDGRNREAAELCYDKDHLFGRNPLVMRLRGNAEYALGEYKKAAGSFGQALESDPNDAMLWHSKGMAEEAMGILDQAESSYNRAVLLNLDEPDFWISRAAIRERKGELRGAIDSLNMAISLRPDTPYALVRKGMIFEKMGKHDNALYFVEMAMMTDPKNKDIRRIQRDICTAAGYIERMIAKAEEAMSNDPSDVQAVSDAVSGYLHLGLMDKATDTMERALRRNKRSIPLLLVRKDMYRALNRPAEVEDTCEKILSVQPENVSVKAELAEAYRLRGDTVAASRLYTDMRFPDGGNGADAADPEDGASLFTISKSMYKEGDLAGAGRMADRALRLDPSNVEYIVFRAKIHRGLREMKSAESLITKSLKTDKTSAALWEADGINKDVAGNTAGALASYDNAAKYGRSSISFNIRHGILRESVGKYSDALKSYNLALSKDPSNEEARWRTALMQLKFGDSIGAQRNMNTVDSSDVSPMFLAVRAKTFQAVGNRTKVRETYEMFRRCKDPDKESSRLMSEVLARAGLSKEMSKVPAETVPVRETVQIEVTDKVKRGAERLLRRAYASKIPVAELDMVDMLDLSEEEAAAITSYLSDIREYGDILVGSVEFDRLEKLSLNAIVKGNCIGIDKDPVISLPCAYVPGAARDADEAKLLVAYIYKVMSSDVGAEILTQEQRDAIKLLPSDASVYEIMKRMRVGIYRARAVKILL